ncbi:cell wall metabolism sensor histidine kinase WalK [Paenibacillus sp. SC116]|uniref:sensor histidine kinase n=1 Tax=Paenibacillus sp. SC116 TaxID=2968986 RepID=UPI00215A1EEB|nr:HAMP domain-containing sensor histidine kinase [Paenibacillus sp. SC116]MCR8842528.1 cell wall metabolism sensor histidine kinase WalK [Paenibacillus sp. SC116]
MKKGIVLKLFVLTTSLCMLILATIFFGQTVFFKQFYAHKKVDEIQKSMQTFQNEYIKSNNNLQVIQQLEQEFHKKHSAWITMLDNLGNVNHISDFYLEIQLGPSLYEKFSNRVITVPLYSMLNIEDLNEAKNFLRSGNSVKMSGITRGTSLVPTDIWISAGPNNESYDLENIKFRKTMYGNVQKEPSPRELRDDLVYDLPGTIIKAQLPLENISPNSIYTNHLLIERIKEFQLQLVLNEENIDDQLPQEIDYEENKIKYKILIQPIKNADGLETYIFAMASLQPVDEAVQMIKEYYIYLVIFVLLLIFLASFYYSKKIAKPLLQLNDTTKKIADLDFSEKIPITSQDEIGDLSQNINKLSSALHSHIHQLQQDIEKEKQLENTRKEFIAGVSHELKTPLSIMKSCLSILKDGVAIHKKDYYFEAMAKEVDKMDMLIVDMLELAKFESGTYQMQKEVFSIDEVIEHTCAQLFMEIERKKLHVQKHLANVDVYANQHRIEQVITNFITNAIHYTPEEEKIIITTTNDGDMVKVCIENQGVHIPEEQLDKIWDRFYRGDASRQRSKGGTGLGLAISKNILELHHVEYGVSNTEDGVLFFFYVHKKV